MTLTPLVRLFIRQGLFGLALGLIFAIMVVGFNVANLRHLVQNVDGGYMAFWLLAFFSGSVFGGAHIAITVMLMQWKTEKEHQDEK